MFNTFFMDQHCSQSHSLLFITSLSKFPSRTYLTVLRNKRIWSLKNQLPIRLLILKSISQTIISKCLKASCPLRKVSLTNKWWATTKTLKSLQDIHCCLLGRMELARHSYYEIFLQKSEIFSLGRLCMWILIL
jgi:hypothetical protein